MNLKVFSSTINQKSFFVSLNFPSGNFSITFINSQHTFAIIEHFLYVRTYMRKVLFFFSTIEIAEKCPNVNFFNRKKSVHSFKAFSSQDWRKKINEMRRKSRNSRKVLSLKCYGEKKFFPFSVSI